MSELIDPRNQPGAKFDERIAAILLHEYRHELGKPACESGRPALSDAEFPARVRKQIQVNLVSRSNSSPWRSEKRQDLFVVGGLTCIVCLFLIVFSQSHHIDAALEKPIDVPYMYANLLAETPTGIEPEQTGISARIAPRGLLLLESGICGTLKPVTGFEPDLKTWNRLTGYAGPALAPQTEISALSDFDDPNGQLVSQITSRLLGRR